MISIYDKGNQMKHLKFTTYFLGLLTLLTSLSSSAKDLYEGSLIVQSPKKAGIIVTGTKNLEARIVIKRNKKNILQLPVSLNEVSIGLSAGAKFSGQTFASFEINGLNPSTQIDDFYETFVGTTAGATFAVPGPCCITLESGNMNLQNSKGLQIQGFARSTGWMLELSQTFMKINPVNKFTERKSITNQNLSQLPELDFQKDESKNQLISLECYDINHSITYFISMNDFNEINVETFHTNFLKDLVSYKTNSLKPYFKDNTLFLYPEQVNGKVIGNRFDIAINSESLIEKKDYFGRNIKYHGKTLSSEAQTDLTCVSKESLQKNLEKLEAYRQSLWIK